MSRQTNSMLLRYGLNTFWSNSINAPNLFYIQQQFNFFFQFILRNHYLLPLKIQYTQKKVKIYTFFYKEDKYSFLYKNLIFRKNIFNKLIFRKKYNVLLTNIKTNKKKILIDFKVLNLANKSLKLKYMLKILKNKKSVLFCNHFFSSLCFNSFKKYLKRKNFFKRQIYYKKNKVKLKLINNYIKNNWLGLFCSYVIFHYSMKKIKVIFVSSIKHLVSSVKFPFSFKYLRNNNLKQKFYMLLLGLSFFKSFIINFYISDIIKQTKNKKHVKNLISFFNVLKFFFQKQITPVSGLKFRIAGRLNGKLRKSSFGFKIGSIKLMSFNVFVDYSCNYTVTQYGSFSLKTWLCDNSFLSIKNVA